MDYTIESICDYLKKNLSLAKYRHSIGVWKIAKKIADKYNINPHKVDIAALLHDIGRKFSIQKMIWYVDKHKIQIPECKAIIKYNPNLLHSFISAHLAKDIFQINDKDILKAIAIHTIGAQDMDDLSKVIYISDMISPDRRYSGVEKLRWISFRNLNKAFQMGLALKISYVMKKKAWIHPEAIKAWNNIIDITYDK